MTATDTMASSPLLVSPAAVEAADRQFLAAAAPFWHPVAASASVEPGAVHKVTLLGEDVALWRAPDGTLGAVVDSCAHRGVRLTAGGIDPAGCVRCPYHGWTYGADGTCTNIPQMPTGPIPTTAVVRAYEVDEHAGLVWLRPVGADAAPRPTLSEFGDPAFACTVGEPFEWSCQSTRQIENFLDVAHFSHIHLGVFGNPDALEVPTQEVEVSDGHLRTEATYPGIDVVSAATGGEPGVIEMTFRYDVHLPFAVRLVNEMGGSTSVLFLANQPVTAHTCRVWWVLAQPAAAALPDDLVQMMEATIFGADQAVVETQRPDAVPLALTAELHLPFDRVAVAYRKALAALDFPLAPGA